MRVRQAKDFLVAQIQQQAALERVPLSDLEVRMLYFTEQGGLSDGMHKLSEEFDQSCNTSEYEKKISNLMKHAYKRIQKEDRQAREIWDRAIRCLRRGDHYILVMWGGNSRFAILFVLGVGVLYFLVIFVFKWIGRNVRPLDPHLLMVLFVAAIVFCVFFQRQLERVFDWVLRQTLDRFLDTNGKGKEGA